MSKPRDNPVLRWSSRPVESAGTGLLQRSPGSSVEVPPAKKSAIAVARSYSARQQPSVDTAIGKAQSVTAPPCSWLPSADTGHSQSACAPAAPRLSLIGQTLPNRALASQRKGVTGQHQSASASSSTRTTLDLKKLHSPRSSNVAPSSPYALRREVPYQTAVEHVSPNASLRPSSLTRVQYTLVHRPQGAVEQASPKASSGTSSPTQAVKELAKKLQADLQQMELDLSRETPAPLEEKIKRTRAAVEELRANLEASKEDVRRAEEPKLQVGSYLSMATDSRSRPGSISLPVPVSPKPLRITTAPKGSSLVAPATTSPRPAYRTTSSYQPVPVGDAQKRQARQDISQSLYQPSCSLRNPCSTKQASAQSVLGTSEPQYQLPTKLQKSQLDVEAQHNAPKETIGQTTSYGELGPRMAYPMHLRRSSLGSTPTSPYNAYRAVLQAQLQRSATREVDGQHPLKTLTVKSFGPPEPSKLQEEDQSPTAASTTASTVSSSMPLRPKMFRDVPSTALLARSKQDQQQAVAPQIGAAEKSEEEEEVLELPAVQVEAPQVGEQVPLAEEVVEVSEEQVAAARGMLERLKHSLPGILQASQGEAAPPAPAPRSLDEVERLPEVTVPVILSEASPCEDGLVPLHLRSLRLATTLAQHETFQGWERRRLSRRQSVSDIIAHGQLRVSAQEIIDMMWRCKSRLDAFMKEDDSVAGATFWTCTDTRWRRIWHMALAILRSDAWQEVVRAHMDSRRRPSGMTSKLWQVSWEPQSRLVRVESVADGRALVSSFCVSPTRIVRHMSCILDAVNWNELYLESPAP